MNKICKIVLFIFFIHIPNLYSNDSISLYDSLPLEDKIKISYDLLGDKMYLIDEDNSIFYGIKIVERIKKVFKKYGYMLSPSSSAISEFESCYKFPNVHVYISNRTVKYIVSKYRLSKISTYRGVSIGDNVSILKKIYGKPYRKRRYTKENGYKRNTMYDYMVNDYYKISFEIEKRNIVRITVHN